MKKLFLLLTSVCAFAIGCQTDSTADSIVCVEEGGTVLAVSLEQTKTSLGKKVGSSYPVFWSEGDKLVANGKLSNEAQINQENPASALFLFEKATLNYPYNITIPIALRLQPRNPLWSLRPINPMQRAHLLQVMPRCADMPRIRMKP
jgi:hypothetical protein